VQPYVALALGLKAAGHEVLIAAPSQFEAFIGMRGIPFAHLPGEFLDLMETPEAKAAMAGGQGFSGGLKLMKHFRPIGRKLLSAEWKAAEEFQPDLIIYHPKAVGAPHIAERLGCPAVLVSPLPGFTPTSAFASPLLPFRSVGPFNRLSHSVMAGSGDFLFRSMIREWRSSELDAPTRPAQRLRPTATIYAYSPHVVPVPTDWGREVAVTGYWFLDDDTGWSPSQELAAFLAAGEPPVYVGFGSMPGLDPVPMTQLFTEALARVGRRGLFATGGGALAHPSAVHIFAVEHAPHDKLFPLVAACVHHGGAGTTAAALRAGKPSVICPFFGDQPFWARRIHELGAGPAPLDRRALSVDAVAAAITAATSDRLMADTADRFGAAIRGEDGIGAAVSFLRRTLAARGLYRPQASLGRGASGGMR
jgi:UDP:flavonoid glycosyltransferase YjiC (YdhE family)